MSKKLKLSFVMLTLIVLAVLYSVMLPKGMLSNINRSSSHSASDVLPQAYSTQYHQDLPHLSSQLRLTTTSYGLESEVIAAEAFLRDDARQSRQNPEFTPHSISISSLDELMALFDSLNYTVQSFQEGNKAIPRLTFDAVGEEWRSVSHQIPVKQKKTVFFRLITPLVLLANEKILQERQIIMSAPLDDIELLALAVKYKVLGSTDMSLLEAQRQTLLERVDILPPSLVLAQAAKESGWGTSRFTLEGNAFFGQWDFNGKGMEPKQKRQGLGNYGLARFDTPLASVEGYLLNLNTHNAYQKMRDLRVQSRDDNQLITGLALAGTLDKYSERGHAYVEGIRQMIRTNKLHLADETYLSDDAPLHLLTRTN
jgi:uncharacterized FlgJ-related protein